jgi:hypothetical protein
MEQLTDVLNTNQYVECVKVGKDDFYDLGEFEDKIYTSAPLSGNTKKYQLFYSSDAEPGILFAKDSNSTLIEYRMDLRKGQAKDRSTALIDFNLEDLTKLEVPGIRKIKQVELFSKWRKHVPEQYKSPLYDDPGDDVLQAVRDERKSKKEYMKERRIVQEAIESKGVMASQKSPP